ncbi:MAG: hypothetical protein M1833_006358 [Piccolia ochrophora]|nr:MAG: hypothetical protein M1833_006358 [Piccolia ochrophora]
MPLLNGHVARAPASDIQRLRADLDHVELRDGEGISGGSDGSTLRRHQSDAASPTLSHRIKHDKSILALALSDHRIYAGTQEGEILVWSLDTYERIASINGHRSSVLCLFVSTNQDLLFSSAGDRIVNVWSVDTLQRLYSIYSTYDVGDIFCVAYSSRLQTVYQGAQNTTIQWYDLKEKDKRPRPDATSHPSHRNHRFFDSRGPGGEAHRRTSLDSYSPHKLGGQSLEIDREHIVQYAHYGYVYCMLMVPESSINPSDEDILITGGGDGTIKIWHLDGRNSGAICETAVMDNGFHSVLSLALDGTLLYAGLLGGDVNVWDLDTTQLVRSIKAHSDDVYTLSVSEGFLFSASAAGDIKKMDRTYGTISHWNGHDGKILAAAVTQYHDRRVFVTGANDNCIAVWDITNSDSMPAKSSETSNEKFLESLATLISYRTVSSDPRYAEDCRRGATYLRTLFKSFGASTEMLTTEGHSNPIVLAKFKGNPSVASKRKRVLFYGHYDVIAAENDQGKWATDPFRMEGINGYLYGRGASDNKGPVVAALYAVADLVAEHALDSDVVFLIEGEEECGSKGFESTITRNKEAIGDIDYILLANSYWIDDEVPCLTYGLRGVILATATIESDRSDLHSGVDGSSLMDESLKDLVAVLSKLNGPHGHVEVPGFYDPILPVTASERARYAAIVDTLLRRNPSLGDSETLTNSLMQRWREPSLTFHGFNVSGPANSTIIPRLARATISIRLVPNQEVSRIQKSLIAFLHTQFDSLGSKNRLSISVNHVSEPWLGDPDNEIFQTLEEAVMDVWGPTTPAVGGHASQTAAHRKPLYIREGGSIPTIRFLEKTFDAPAANLPSGQASDGAHLDNERLRITNLYKAREIFKRVFRELPTK